MSDQSLVSLQLDFPGGQGYQIVIGSGLLAEAGVRLQQRLGNHRRLVVISDRTVFAYHGQALLESLNGAGFKVDALPIEAGESSKSWEMVTRIIDGLMELQIDRHTVIIAFGGGVIGDLAGFIAAITLRGLDFIQIPTSLLAQVDSSVGGKTGINVKAGKNLVGAFHQPKLVLSDLDLLQTLPSRELRAGYAECVKHALLMGDLAMLDWMEQHGQACVKGDATGLAKIIAHSCQTKATIVASDEKEAGNRALLNLGHTFGHAIEAVWGYGSVIHGEAVAIGLVMAARLSARLGYCSEDWIARISNHLRAVGLPVSLSEVAPPESLESFEKLADSLLAAMVHDKKNSGGKLNFVLLREPLAAFVAKGIDPNLVREVLLQS
ncbi:MAG: 3-dehydroquinate synthase [Candidatus Pacebacteria bacterium]|nr:3-dehydroquinate synthase [Candidatus Paceibacterota bacterium]